MYARHFGFSADPFQLTADQRLFYRFVYLGMLLTGLKLLWDAVAA